MMLAVEFADFGFGTVVGAIVAGAIAIFLDQRRRKDEKKRFFLEEKRLVYKNVVQSLEMFCEQIVLFSKFLPYFNRVEELDPEAQQIVREAYEGLQGTLAQSRRRFDSHSIDISLLGSRRVLSAAKSAMGTLRQMMLCIEEDERCDLTIMQVMFEEQLHRLSYYARHDLGMDA
jgi:hypothetical protein